MVTPFRWGIAGFGWVARDYALPGILAAGGEVVAIADLAEPARAAARRRVPGVSVYPALAPMLADGGFDAIYIATPNDSHRAATEQALAAGKPVLCEKPMAATLADAEAMAAAARSSGLVYGTAFDQRFHPAHAAMRAAIAGGAIGTVTAIRIVYACWLPPEWRCGDALGNWRADPNTAGGGAMMDLAPHGLDLATYLLGEPLADAGLHLSVRREQHESQLPDGLQSEGVLQEADVK